MRFGHQLRTSLIRDYYYSYIAYDDLKAALKTPFVSDPNPQNPNPPHREWTEQDETNFVRQLEQELDKVFTFQHVKSEDIARRITVCEQEVSDVIARAKDENPARKPSEEEFILLEQDLSDVIADVHDLAKFTQLNYTGFQKIIKKHDKLTSWSMRAAYNTRLQAKPFWKDNYDALIVKLSKLYDDVRTRGNPVKGDSSAGGSQQNFVRNTTKYWVHPDNITELKLIILKHLPVLVFNRSKEFDAQDSAISSIYYDNVDTWELYEGRLKKTEGAEAIRLRWYGGMNTDTIYVERKTHREDWTGEKSVKARFEIKEKNVNDFLAGKMTAAKVIDRLRKDPKKSEKELKNLQRLAEEIQFRVLDRKLVPVTRSFYNRIAFQLPGDARVRISLDTELTMTREDNLDGRRRAGDNWRRMDIGIDYPFKQLPSEDVERFRYAVLEVKLQTQAGQEPPQWIRDLTASHLVEAVPKFSKFIHGTAKLNPGRINLIPFWMPQMDADIRKPVTQRFGIEHPSSTDASTSANLDDDYSDDDDADAEAAGPSPPTTQNDETINRLRAAREAMEQHHYDTLNAVTLNADPNVMDAEERAGENRGVERISDFPIYDSEDEDDEIEAAKRIGGLYYARKLAAYHLRHTASALSRGLTALAPVPHSTSIPEAQSSMGIPRGSQVERKRFKAPRGKKIHIPVRVEPKVFFASERTFLAWLEFSIIVGSIAAALLNFGDSLSIAAAFSFTVVAAACLLYSLGLYLWRVDAIRVRKAVDFHDSWGPTLLCLGLLAAIGVSFGFRWGVGGELRGGFKG